MKGILYFSIDDNFQALITSFDPPLNFEYDVKFISRYGTKRHVLILLALRIPNTMLTEKLEFQYLDFDIEEKALVQLNYLHMVQKPLEFIDSDETPTKPLIVRFLDSKNPGNFVACFNYSDRSLESSKLLMVKTSTNKFVEDDTYTPKYVISIPILAEIVDKIPSTSRSCYIQEIKCFPNKLTSTDEDYGRERINTETSDHYLKPLSTNEMFMAVLSTDMDYPSILLYSGFDGRLIEIKSAELYGQSIIQNNKLYQEMTRSEVEEKVIKRKRAGVPHAYATDDGLLVLSNGFIYDFYDYDFVGEGQDRYSLILEQNLAYEKELSTYGEFPKLQIEIDPYDGQQRMKWGLKDDLFLNPARLYPRCCHLISYASQKHVASMVKKAVIEYSSQV